MTDTQLAEFFHAVEAERAAQLAKWGDQRHPDGTNLANDGWRDHARKICQQAAAEGRVTWAHILQEEFVEALAEVDPAKIRAELVQVASVCAAWISDIDRRDAEDAEPWHSLETAYDGQYGPALVLRPSGQCGVGCIDPGCPTMKAFAEQDIDVPRGEHRIRARRTATGVVLDIEPSSGG